MIQETHKLTADYGNKTGNSLFQRYKKLAPDLMWEEKDTIDIGCHWGYLQLLLKNKVRVRSAIGVDIKPQWQFLSEADNPNNIQGVSLLEGDVTTIPQLQDKQFDIALSSGTLMTMQPSTLDAVTNWAYEHLRPSGSFLLSIRTYLSYAGGDYHALLKENIPYAHLLFGKHAVTEALGTSPRYMIPYCASTWAMHFFRHGFEVVNMVRSSNSSSDIRKFHAHKLRHYDESELATGEVLLWLRKPANNSDIEIPDTV